MSSWTDSMIERQAKQSAGATQSFRASRNWLHFQRLLSRLVTFDLTIAPSLKVKLCWSNAAAYAKSRAFRDLCLWCDLWLGSLVCSIWSFIDLRSFSRGLGKIRHSERSQETKQRSCVSCVNRLPGQRKTLRRLGSHPPMSSIWVLDRPYCTWVENKSVEATWT